ncbi:hypothetical protein J4217_04540 [Candidatus Pacearchaeota archaeon]|nr:hypothetical protein [Candidatus Pacearchaeota archaeon]
MEKTEIQRKIENVVTNGLGYHSRTKFLTDETVTDKYILLGQCFLDEDFVKNSRGGLRAHLADLDSRIKLPRLRKIYNIIQRKRDDIGGSFSLRRLGYSIDLFRLGMGISAYESSPKTQTSLAINNATLRMINGLFSGRSVSNGFGRYLASEVFTFQNLENK